MTGASAFFNHLLFSKTRFHALGFLRIVLVYSMAPGRLNVNSVTDNDRGYVNWAVDAVHEPGLLIKLLGAPFPVPAEWATELSVAYFVVAAFAITGLFCRPALLAFGLATIYLAGIDAARGLFDHQVSFTSQVILILAFAPGATAISLDRFIKWSFKKNRPEGSLWQYLLGPAVPVWGLRTILILLGCTYFAAGFSKVRYGGLKWADGHTLSHYLDGSAHSGSSNAKPMFIGPTELPEACKWKDGYGIYSYSYGNRQSSHLSRQAGKFIAAHKPLIIGASVATVLFQLAGILLLLANGWVRILYLLLAILMHKTIGVLMGLPFPDYQIVCFLLLDWRWICFKLRP